MPLEQVSFEHAGQLRALGRRKGIRIQRADLFYQSVNQ
jgi:hypothetical protein